MVINTAQQDNIFRKYDVRGIVPDQLNPEVAYRVAQAFFTINPGDRYVIAHDMRSSSIDLVKAIAQAAKDANKQLDYLGMISTDFVYFAVGGFDYDGGIMITASHNPREWNGIKLVGKNVTYIDTARLKEIYESQHIDVPNQLGSVELQSLNSPDYVKQYLDHVLQLTSIDSIPQLKIVIDAGNGLGGIMIRKLFSSIPQVEVIESFFEPHPYFPHHEANPAVQHNTTALSELVVKHGANLGVAFDGDADRCFFVDELGNYLPGYLSTALLSKIMLQKFPASGIAYDYRNIMAIEDAINSNQGNKVITPSGNSNFKLAMRDADAVFGGEASGHFYFKHNFYADNGLMPVLLMLELLGTTNQTLSELTQSYRQKYFVSGEQNFIMPKDLQVDALYSYIEDSFHGEKASRPDGLVMEFESWRFNIRASNTEPLVRVNIEASSQAQLDRGVVLVHESLSKFGLIQGDYSGDGPLLTDRDKFNKIINNLWYSWSPHYVLPFTDLFGDTWRKNTPPGEFYSQYGKKRYEDVLEQNSWHIDQSLRLFNDYIENKHTWYQAKASKATGKDYSVLLQNPVAYFSLEYGLVDWLQIYSGGLGVLAGDTIKQASDLGLPLVGVGIFYHQGYFHQDFDQNGYQQETYISQNPLDYPMEQVLDSSGSPLEVSIEIIDHEVWVRAWKLHVGRTPLILLDTNFDKNQSYEDKMISAHLYGGDQDTRIRQEILLGIGGPRMLCAMGVKPSLYHMNEGHSGFLVIELARRYIEEKGLDFNSAVKLVDDHLVFTNHTLKQAGNDIFSYDLMQKYFGTYLDNLQASMDQVYDLGKDQLYAGGQFSMTVLGLRNAKVSNAVSKLHGKAAKKLWPDHSLVAITNGVHMPTWIAPEIHRLLDKYVGEDWHNPERNHLVDFNKISSIPDAELWQAHKSRKKRLIESINTELGYKLNPNALTIAWARRVAAYKRPDLITQDINRLAEIVNNQDTPVQILLAGKAHPRDDGGKHTLQALNQSFADPCFKDKVVIIPGYNWQLARRMVSGADIWLNTPFRYEEASGTSGMKAAANGVVQFTTLDGWTDEVDWRGKGWVIDEQDSAHSLYYTLQNEICPTFFETGQDGYGSRWVAMMKESIKLVIYNYSTQRMLTDYLDKIYLPTILESTEFNDCSPLDRKLNAM